MKKKRLKYVALLMLSGSGAMMRVLNRNNNKITFRKKKKRPANEYNESKIYKLIILVHDYML
jgi:hypothetical protein